jgi:hypothetical protein
MNCYDNETSREEMQKFLQEGSTYTDGSWGTVVELSGTFTLDYLKIFVEEFEKFLAERGLVSGYESVQ